MSQSEPRGSRPGAGRDSHLLDVDVDLAAALEPRTREVARPTTVVRVHEVHVGEHELEPLIAAAARGVGVLVLDGVIVVDVHVGDRTTSELVGAGDVLRPDDSAGTELLPVSTSVRALVQSRVALLNEAFCQRIRPWPQILLVLLQRANRRTMELNAQRAATCHPRADARIALLLWHLASQWGVAGEDGTFLPLPLTHRLIGQLVGAERPSVSHALARLSAARLVSRRAGGLVLHGSPAHHIACLVEREPRPVRPGTSSTAVA
jgi:CRP/FNR family cyclic AMP-dependent transcriptional regulator